MNRIDEFADALQGWLVEWAEKREVSSGAGAIKASVDSADDGANGVVQIGRTAIANAGSSPAIIGSGYVSEDGGYIPDWRDEAGITDASAESERFK